MSTPRSARLSLLLIASVVLGSFAQNLAAAAPPQDSAEPTPTAAQNPAPAVTETPETDPPPTTQTGETMKSPSVEFLRGVKGEIAPPIAFYPDLTGPSLNWFAVVVILLLSFRARPILSWRNLDGVVLALGALLLIFRSDAGDMLLGSTGRTWQWWGYTALAGVAGYWLLRGVGLVFARRAVSGDCNVSEGAMLALILAGLAIGFGTIITAPLTVGSRDGVIGGLQTLETGKLPYGDVPGHDSRSPLLYLMHAGAMQLSRPTFTNDIGSPVKMTSANRDQWNADSFWGASDLGAVRIVNGSLFVLVLLGLLVIGSRLHSTAIGLTMFVIFAVFPGTLECLPEPDIMLPAALLTWSLATALLPGVGGLLSALLLVFAGVAWPWAWLALPIVLAYFMRRGSQGLGAIAGTVVGAAAVMFGVATLTAPSLPRPDGALAAAGQAPGYAASLDDSGAMVVTRRESLASVDRDFKSWFWRFLVDGEDTKVKARPASATRREIRAGESTELTNAYFRVVQPETTAGAELQREYRAELKGQTTMARAYASFRTVAEATWLPTARPASEIKPPWQVWLGDDPAATGRITSIRRGVKIGAGLLSLLLAAAIFFGRRNRPHQLLGGMLAVCSAALLADDLGAAANLAWLAPLVLALWANDEETRLPAVPPRSAVPSNFGGRAPTPRITIEG